MLTAGSRSRAHASTFAIATASAASARTTKAAAPEPASATSSGMLRRALRESNTAQRVPPASSCSAARAELGLDKRMTQRIHNSFHLMYLSNM